MSLANFQHHDTPDEVSKSFDMSRAFSEMSTSYQEGTPSEMFTQTQPSPPPVSRQVKPFFRPAKNPVLERLHLQESLAASDMAQAAGNANTRSVNRGKNQFQYCANNLKKND